MERGEGRFFALQAVTPFVVAVNHFVELLRQIEVGLLFGDVEVIEVASHVEADVKPGPIAWIGGRLLERFQNIARSGGGQIRRAKYDGRGTDGPGKTDGTGDCFHPWPG